MRGNTGARYKTSVRSTRRGHYSETSLLNSLFCLRIVGNVEDKHNCFWSCLGSNQWMKYCFISCLVLSDNKVTNLIFFTLIYDVSDDFYYNHCILLYFGFWHVLSHSLNSFNEFIPLLQFSMNAPMDTLIPF